MRNLVSNKKIITITVLGIACVGVFFTDHKLPPPEPIVPTPTLLSATASPVILKNIALTFDDGPYGTSTEKILDILKQENIHASFFIIGKNVEKYPELTRRIVAEGHIIGNHSFDHSKKLSEMSTTTFAENINKAEDIIASTTKIYPKIFRPPYGKSSSKMFEVLNKEKYISVLWNIDSKDWDDINSTTDLIEKETIQSAKTNGIILFHDGRDIHVDYPRENIINALPAIIQKLKSAGYTFVTIDKILNTRPYFD